MVSGGLVVLAGVMVEGVSKISVLFILYVVGCGSERHPDSSIAAIRSICGFMLS